MSNKAKFTSCDVAWCDTASEDKMVDAEIQKLRSFVLFALDKLDAKKPDLQDGSPEEDFQELVWWAKGMARNLRSTAARAPQEVKTGIMQGLAPAWDLRTDRPGPDLSAEQLREALASLLSTVLAAEEEEEEASAGGDEVAPVNLASMTLQDAVTHLWNVDKGQRLEWGDTGFTFDLQSKGYGTDKCATPLFSWVNTQHPFWASPVTLAFVSLLDNYEREVTANESTSREEKQEIERFLDALGETAIMRFCLAWLRKHGIDPRCAKLHSMADFKHVLYDLWFAPYRRGSGYNGSSGFEHVFVGEEKNGKISGLHNWVQFYLEEKKGAINYLGWKGKQDSDYSDDVNLVTVKFSWEDDDRDGAAAEEKLMSTILCGSTVELEIAMLTLAFLGGNQQGGNRLWLGNEEVNIVCYGQRVRYGPPKVGTAYLEIA
jgi:poly(U)-specific endoribonuclease